MNSINDVPYIHGTFHYYLLYGLRPVFCFRQGWLNHLTCNMQKTIKDTFQYVAAFMELAF